ncbi:hypothetical protein V5O48_019673, partial [Marasmius crinis-equi]
DHQADEDIQLVEVPALLTGLKVVEIDNDSGAYGDVKMIWLERAELDRYIQNGTLSQAIEDFRHRYGQESDTQKTILLLHGIQQSALSELGYDVEMCWREIQYPCLHRAVESVQDAANVIGSYMHGLLR